MMSSLTDRMFQTAVEGLLNRESELCSQVVADDEEIDTLEKKVDQDGINLLVQHQFGTDRRPLRHGCPKSKAPECEAGDG